MENVRSRERIAVLMVGCSTKASEINLFLQQCKHLNNRIFDFTYLSTCRFREEKKDVEYFNDLNETCGGNSSRTITLSISKLPNRQ